MRSQYLLAYDLGAGSGRAVVGEFADGRLGMREVHRFANHPVEIGGHLHWNYIRLFDEMKTALAGCRADGITPVSMGIDAWGVDFGLLAGDGSVIGQPYAYRDRRTDGLMEEFFAVVPRERIYALTGIQFMQFNTLFQLFSMTRAASPQLGAAERLLFMPDLFTYLFSGAVQTEYTIASTSQLLNPADRTWQAELVAALGLSPGVLPPVTAPGSVAGPLREDIRRATGMGGIPVVTTAGHDTAAAVAAVPARGDDWAYISSGTWSLMGVELDHPVITQEALQANFTNEGGVGGTTRLLKNIAGLWLLQESKQVWDREQVRSYEELCRMAVSAVPFRTLLDPDADDFLNPGNMPAAIQAYATRTDQCAPATVPEYVRCILESLAMKYRYVLEQLRRLVPRPIRTLHIIGGGSHNRLLCQLAADATGLPVLAGPVEATAAGNILVQALAMGLVDGIGALRETMLRSCDVQRYEPHDTDRWEEPYRKFCALLDPPAAHTSLSSV